MSDRAFLGAFEQIVLLAVARLTGEEEAYGPRLRREIEERAGRSVSVGALYATLGRLEKKGYVASRVGEPTPQRGGRAKRFFRLTPAGERALRHSREMLAAMWRGVRLGPSGEDSSS